MSEPTHVTRDTFEAEVLRAEVPVLADFWAEWCGPCRMIAPIVEDLAREYAGRVKVAKVDVDENPQLAVEYGIMSIPTLGLFWHGKLVDRFIGYMPTAQLKQRLEAALNAHTLTVGVS
ncbi:MAG: thioredoxin [bacterium]